MCNYFIHLTSFFYDDNGMQIATYYGCLSACSRPWSYANSEIGCYFLQVYHLANKYKKSAVHHERRTALFSANRAGFNIYSLNPLPFLCGCIGRRMFCLSFSNCSLNVILSADLAVIFFKYQTSSSSINRSSNGLLILLLKVSAMWTYLSVVLMLLCPISSFTILMSVPCSSKWVANEWRSRCG